MSLQVAIGSIMNMLARLAIDSALALGGNSFIIQSLSQPSMNNSIVFINRRTGNFLPGLFSESCFLYPVIEDLFERANFTSVYV